MTRAQRELRITWAEQRTFAGRVVDRRRSPLLAPVPDRRRHRHRAPRPAHPAGGRLGRASWPASGPSSTRAGARAVAGARRAPSLARPRRARAARVAPEAVLPDHVLARIADARPADVAELGAVRGVGAILAARFGPDLLDDPAVGRAGTGGAMRFTVEQRFSADADAVARAFAGARPLRRDCPATAKLAAPEVVAPRERRRPGGARAALPVPAATSRPRPGPCSTRPG